MLAEAQNWKQNSTADQSGLEYNYRSSWETYKKL